MKLNKTELTKLSSFFESLSLLPPDSMKFLENLADEKFTFREQLNAADSIHLHIKVSDTSALPEKAIVDFGGVVQNSKEGYVKYAFAERIHFIFSSIPVSQEEKAGLNKFEYPHLDHIGIDLRNESQETFRIFHKIPFLASTKGWKPKKQGGDGKKVYCCHVQVNEKYWVYPCNNTYLEFAFGKLVVDASVFGCDLRPADPALGIVEDKSACCG